jgi:hypothetical protein
MIPTDMEQVLENLDRRLARIEQILPTLATKEELQAVGTRAQAQIESLHDDVRIIAEGYQSLDGNARTLHSNVRSLHSDVRSLHSDVRSLTHGLTSLTTRLERKGVI